MLWLVRSNDPPVLQEAAEPEPIVVAVTPGTRDGATPAGVVLRHGPTTIARSAGPEGLVTAIIQPGESMGQGQVIAEVDGLPLFALVSPAPLHRSLSTGDQGPDVLALANLLIETGDLEPSESDDQLGPVVAAAISHFQSRTGHEQVRRNNAGTVVGVEFDPSWTVWIGPNPLRSVGATVDVGQQWPAVGEPVLREATVAVRGDLVAVGPDGLPTLNGQWQIEFDGQSHNLDGQGTLTGAPLAAFEQALERNDGAESAGSPSADTDGTEGAGQPIPVIVRLKDPEVVSMVPPSSVIIDAEQRTCVFVPADDGPGWQPEPTTIVDGTFGSSMLSPLAGAHVLANPRSVLGPDPACA